MTGIIPEEEETEFYDDVGTVAPIEPGEDIYEELPGLTTLYCT